VLTTLFHNSFIRDNQTSDSCVDGIVRYVLWRAWPSTRIVGTRTQWPGKCLAIIHCYEYLPNISFVGTLGQLLTWLLVQCIIIGAFVKHTSRGKAAQRRSRVRMGAEEGRKRYE
jgi:hypothetical protein